MPEHPTPSPTARLAEAATTLRRAVLRRRRAIAALLLGVATLASLRALAPPPAPSEVVTVAARDLPAGHLIEPEDLVDQRLPPGVVPAGVLEAPQGRLLAAPLRRGEPVTDVRVVGAGLAAGLPAGSVAAPARLSDAGQAALLSVGDAVDVLAAGVEGEAPQRVAACARVLAVPAAADAADPALPGRLVVLGVRGEEARTLGVRAATGYVTYTWCRR